MSQVTLPITWFVCTGFPTEVKMNDLEKRVISQNRNFLENKLDVKDILTLLIQESVITDDDEERIRKEATRTDQAKKLLSILPYKEDSFSCLVKCVEKTQRFIAKKLQTWKTELVEEWTVIGETNCLLYFYIHVSY